ncbi:MAG: hypothetical protein ACE366_23765 [Bradymonadia bacterium]
MWLCLALVGCDDGGEDDADVVDVDMGVEAEDAAINGADLGFCDEDLPVQSWANFGQGFVTTYCAGCHSAESIDRKGAPAGVDFDTEAQAMAFADRILARTTGEMPDMPPAGGPPPETLERVRIWLECN